MDSPVVATMILPAFETSMRKCERCPTRYLECKRIGEEGYRLCCACWWELAEDTIVYGRDAFSRHGGVPESTGTKEALKNYSDEVSRQAGTDEGDAYRRQVARNKASKLL